MQAKQRKLVYWVCECQDDSTAYNIRAKTRREAKALLKEREGDEARFGPIKKVEVEYWDTFDLVVQSLSEGGGGWECQTGEDK